MGSLSKNLLTHLLAAALKARLNIAWGGANTVSEAAGIGLTGLICGLKA